MLMIRLARYGAKKKPFYHIVAIDKRRARNAICTEKLGFYHPMEKQAQINLERVKYWLSTGAKCSETAAELIKKYEKGELQPAKPVQKEKPKAEKTASPETSTKKTSGNKAEKPSVTTKSSVKIKETDEKESAEKEPKKEEAPKEEA